MNFRIGQKVRLITEIPKQYINKVKPEFEAVYTVKYRNKSVLSSVPFISLEEIVGMHPFGFPSEFFECAEEMEYVDKAVKDLIDGKIPITTCYCSDVPFKMDILVDCFNNALSDKELKSQWRRSVRNEEYENSRIYHDELINRNLVKIK